MHQFNLHHTRTRQFDFQSFIESWRDEKKSTPYKFVPLTAQDVCERWITEYAVEAQNKMIEASERDDAKSRRLYQYIRRCAFSIVRHETVRPNNLYEVDTQRYMMGKLDDTLEIFTTQYDEIRKAIAANSPYKKELKKIMPEFCLAFDSLADASEKLHRSLAKINLAEFEKRQQENIKNQI